MRGESKRAGVSESAVLPGRFGRPLEFRRVLEVDLPEFVIFALEARLAEANAGATAEELSTLNELIESELVNLISLRDVAELEAGVPGFMDAVRQWVMDVGE
jgi:hypothetical protein